MRGGGRAACVAQPRRQGGGRWLGSRGSGKSDRGQRVKSRDLLLGLLVDLPWMVVVWSIVGVKVLQLGWAVWLYVLGQSNFNCWLEDLT